MNKVCLLGAPLETANMGVSALATSFVKIMRHVDKGIDVSLLVGAQKSGYKLIDLGESLYNIKIINHRMSPKAHLRENLLWILFLSFLWRIISIRRSREKIIESNKWLREMDESIFVGSMHGGDSFSDIYGLARFWSAVIPDFIAILLKKPLVLLPQTYGPYKHSTSKAVAKYLIQRSSIVLCRDLKGPDIVKTMIGNAKFPSKILFCPDVAFFLHSNSACQSDIIPSSQDVIQKPVIGINVNGLMYKGGYSRNNMFGLNLAYDKLINSIVKKILSNSHANIILIPHNNAPRGNIESDLDACEEVLRVIPNNLKSRVRVIEHKHSPSEIKGVISKCNFFIGSRMHSCIAALSSGIPTIGIAYSMKFIGVFQSIGADELVVDARSANIETSLNLIWKHYENRDFWSDFLKSRVPGLHKTIIDTFKDITKVDLSI